MTPLNILTTIEKKQFDATPVFTGSDRKRYFTFPAGIMALAKTLKLHGVFALFVGNLSQSAVVTEWRKSLAIPGENGRPQRTPADSGMVAAPEPVGNIVDGFQLVHYGHSQVDDGRMQQLLQDWSAIRQYVTEQQQSQSRG